ncbi:MAG TPA: hypothetical protein VHI95_00895 [Acidimicrobiales bacterium]|jgi:hypothetical protein|nr:hypothetical protein [Acidimicrobiales bacterium]
MTPARIALGTIGVVLGVVAVLALRSATMATHQPVDLDSKLELVVAARTHGGESGQTLDEMVHALLLTCRLRVNADLDGAMQSEGNGLFRGTLSPSLDASNRREFRGCLEDWAIEHLQVDVISLTEPDQ